MKTVVLLIALSTPSQQLATLDRELVLAEDRLYRAQDRSTELASQEARLQAEVAAASLRSNEAWLHLKDRLQSLARLPRGERVAALGKSESFADYLVTKSLLRRITRHDHALHRTLRQEQDRLATAEAALRETREASEAHQRKLKARRDQVATSRARHRGALKTVKDDAASIRAFNEAQRKRAAQRSKRLRSRRAARGFASNRGRHLWPIRGKVLYAYGTHLDATSADKDMSLGIGIEAKGGDSVRAIADGVVVYASWLEGYGRTAVVDHGGGYHSIYAHLSRLNLPVGAQVLGGQPLGLAGDSGTLRGTHVYFELRHQGDAKDPISWLQRR